MKVNRLTIMLVAMGSLLFTGLYAAEKTQSANGNIVTSSGQQTDKKLHIQTFPLHGATEVKLNFIYENNKLKLIMIKNIGGESKNTDIQVNILGKNHVLGLDDNITVEPSNVDKIVLHVEPYDPENVHSIDDAFELGKTYLFSRNDHGIYLLHTKAQ